MHQIPQNNGNSRGFDSSNKKEKRQKEKGKEILSPSNTITLSPGEFSKGILIKFVIGIHHESIDKTGKDKDVVVLFHNQYKS